ncbi:MAG: hypothetical protein KDN05_02275 [Verrucomicrobiae bacterium]|nr:hypothetical protein [Verrucomicrobiae bacterium]
MKSRKIPKPTVLLEFFGGLDEPTRNMLLLSLNLEANTEMSQKEKQEKLEAELLRRTK